MAACLSFSPHRSAGIKPARVQFHLRMLSMSKHPVVLILILMLCGSPAWTEAPVVTEWVVPYAETRPRDPGVDQATGRVFFVGQTGDYVAALDPVEGAFQKWPLEPGVGPHNLIVADSIVWYAGNRAAHIGRLDPATGAIRKIPMPDAAARDPHTLIMDANGDIWFTVQGGNFVGKLETATDDVHLIPVPTPGSRPYGIGLNSSGEVWVTLFGTNKLARIDPAALTLEEVALPRSGARPRRLAITSDDLVWYVDYAEGYLGRVDPGSGEITEWQAPSGAGSRPYAMAADGRDRIWFVQTGPQPNLFSGFDPALPGFLDAVPIDSGGGTVRHMIHDAASNAIWFGTDANTVGRATLPE